MVRGCLLLPAALGAPCRLLHPTRGFLLLALLASFATTAPLNCTVSYPIVSAAAAASSSFATSAVDGPPGVATFAALQGAAAVDGSGVVYFTDANRVRSYNASTRQVASVAGLWQGAASFDGVGNTSKLNSPSGLAVNAAGTLLFVADTLQARIRVAYALAPGVPSGLDGSRWNLLGAGSQLYNSICTGGYYLLDGAAHNVARCNLPQGLALVNTSISTTAEAQLYFADTANNVVRYFHGPSNYLSTVAGSGSPYSADGAGTNAGFQSPASVALAPGGATLYVSDARLVRAISLPGFVVTTLLGGMTALGAQVTGAGSVDGVGSAALLRVSALLGPSAGGDAPPWLVDTTPSSFTFSAVKRVTVGTGTAAADTAAGGVTSAGAHTAGVGGAANFWNPVGGVVLNASAALVFGKGGGNAGTCIGAIALVVCPAVAPTPTPTPTPPPGAPASPSPTPSAPPPANPLGCTVATIVGVTGYSASAPASGPSRTVPLGVGSTVGSFSVACTSSGSVIYTDEQRLSTYFGGAVSGFAGNNVMAGGPTIGDQAANPGVPQFRSLRSVAVDPLTGAVYTSEAGGFPPNSRGK